MKKLSLILFVPIFFIAMGFFHKGDGSTLGTDIEDPERLTIDECNKINLDGKYEITLGSDAKLASAAFLKISTDWLEYAPSKIISGIEPDEKTLNLLFQAAYTSSYSELTKIKNRDIFFFAPIVTITWKDNKCWLTQVSSYKFEISDKNQKIDFVIESYSENDKEKTFVINVNGEKQHFVGK